MQVMYTQILQPEQIAKMCVYRCVKGKPGQGSELTRVVASKGMAMWHRVSRPCSCAPMFMVAELLISLTAAAPLQLPLPGG
jgi:hypothetical protein